MAGNDISGQQRSDGGVHFRPFWGIAYYTFVNAVDGDIDRIEVVIWIHQPFSWTGENSVTKWCDSDLANAAETWVGSFNINHDKVHALSESLFLRG
jgi:hypothetical protein